MADHVAVALVLPKANPDITVNNVNLTGLNNIDFKAISTDRILPKAQPFAEASSLRAEIPLYGSANLPENRRSYSPEKSVIAVASPVKESSPTKAGNASQEVVDFFNQVNWDNLSLDYKIIHYARFATRLAANHAFDVIFASNWLTYLAGNELHLITGKPLAIQLNTLSQDHRDLNNQGWRYELEKMVIERSDYIFTANPVIADSVKTAYSLLAAKVTCLDNSSTVQNSTSEWATTSVADLDQETPAGARNLIPLDQVVDWESQANKMVQVLTGAYTTVV